MHIGDDVRENRHFETRKLGLEGTKMLVEAMLKKDFHSVKMGSLGFKIFPVAMLKNMSIFTM